MEILGPQIVRPQMSGCLGAESVDGDCWPQTVGPQKVGPQTVGPEIVGPQTGWENGGFQ